MVEGGGQVLASFFRAGLVDRFTVFVAPMLIGGTTSPAMLAGPETPGPEAALFLERETAEPMDDGWLLSYRPRAGPPEHP
jgi:riboflavin biosynthesis pyrimidine reductase